MTLIAHAVERRPAIFSQPFGPMESSKRKAPEKHSSEWQPPEMRDLMPDEEAQLDRMHDDVGRMFYGEKWPEIRERWRRLNGGCG